MQHDTHLTVDLSHHVHPDGTKYHTDESSYACEGINLSNKSIDIGGGQCEVLVSHGPISSIGKEYGQGIPPIRSQVW
jgi:hypothetical protein